MKTPTADTYSSLEDAYDFFNRRLFEDRLPPCLLTLQRKGKRTYGFFSPGRFESTGGDSSDELAMNPIHFGSRNTTDILSTLAHEMTHVEQEHFGKPGRRGYHNKAWGLLMKRIGLHPSNTGQPGGKMTGQQMTHYVISGGPFDRACAEFLKSGFRLAWGEVDPTKKEEGKPDDPAEPAKKDRTNRVRFVCSKCPAKAWGKPSLRILCGRCEVAMFSIG